MTRFRSLSLFGALALAACAEAPVTPTSPELLRGPGMASVRGDKSYVLIAGGDELPANLAATVAASGGQLTSSLAGAGVAVATSSDPDFAAKAGKSSGLQVVEDFKVTFPEPTVADVMVDDESESGVGDLAAIGGVETFRAVQWAPDAVSAPAAWQAGYQGAGARVAILDGGIHRDHVDIKPNLDRERSLSMVPGQVYYNDQLGDDATGECAVKPDGSPVFDSFWHGTHVAGIVAAPANNIGTVGIAPKATIIGVKVLHCGSGFFSWIINGIYYAATPISEGGAGANIINMSLGAGITKGGGAVAQLLKAVNKATKYAHQRGVTVIAAAGNSGINIDPKRLVFVPAESKDVIAVSATGPAGWAIPNTVFDLDRPASYSNFGRKAIDFAAPGGDFSLFPTAVTDPGFQVCAKQRFPLTPVLFVFQRCWVFDMVMSSVRGGPTSTSSYSWAAGTSMASPAVAGVAALIVGKYPGISPDGVKEILENSADQLGNRPGKDVFYGKGRVNAFRAVQ